MKVWKVVPLIFLALTLTGAAHAVLLIFPRHVNPNQLSEELPLPLLLLAIYRSVGESIASFDIASAKANITLAGQVYVPPNLRYILERFNNILNEIADRINSTKQLVEEARELVEKSEPAGAIDRLDKAKLEIVRAEILYGELVEVSKNFGRLGLSAAQLSEVLEDVSNAIEGLRGEIEELYTVAKQLVHLEETQIELQVTPKNVTVGEEIVVRGRLETGEHSPLSGKKITVHVGLESLEVESGEDGRFTLYYKVTSYTKRLPVYAEYVPRGVDVGLYKYSRSTTTYVNVNFITPLTLVTLDLVRLCPLDTLRISVHTLPNLTLAVKTPFKTFKGVSSESGRVTLTLRIPASAEEGQYQVTASTKPKGVIGPSSASATFYVEKLTPKVEVSVPNVVFTGIEYAVRVKVNVTSKVLVTSQFQEPLEHVGTSFSFPLYAPHVNVGGKSELVVKVNPEDPKFKSVEYRIELTVYNTLLVAASIAVFVVPATSYLSRRTRKGLESVEPKGSVYESGVVEERREERDPLALLFQELVIFFNKVFRVELKKTDTLREYLSRLSQKMPREVYALASKAILGLERVVYGGVKHAVESLTLEVAKAMKSLVEMLKQKVEER